METRFARGACIAFLAGTAMLATRARAQNTFSPVEWQAPSQCPDSANVNRNVAENLGKSNVDTKVRALARVQPAKSGFFLTLSVSTGTTTGERTLNAERCETLADAVALIVALAIDPEAVASHRANVQDAGSPQDAAESTLDAAPDSGVSDARRDVPYDAAATASIPLVHRSNSQLNLAVRGGVESGRLPNATGLFDVAAGLQISKVAFEVRGQYALAQRTNVAAGPGGLFQYWSVGAHGCLRWILDSFRLGPCAGLSIDRLSAEGRNVLRSRSESTTWATLALAGYARWDVTGPFFLDFRLEGAWLPTRPTVVVDPDTTVFEPSVISASSSVGLGLAWDL